MGKIRIKTIGDESLEEAEKKKNETKRAEKLSRAKSASGGKARESDGDLAIETTNKPGVAEEEGLPAARSSFGSEGETRTATFGRETSDRTPEKSQKSKKSKFVKQKSRSAKYKSAVMEIDKDKTYLLPEALDLLRKVKIAKFNETVELHINTTEAGISGTVKLPHGNGKELRIAIADDSVLAEVEKGKINFDILIAAPSVMPKLAKVAKVLGPRGLMPNPKNGTISDNPEEAAKKFQAGLINFKTESKVPVMHLTVGKTSFEDSQLTNNIQTIITAVKKDRITKITLKSTMSPGIRLQV